MNTLHKILAAACFSLSILCIGPRAHAADAGDAPATTSHVQALTVPTFHCLSVYWSPEKGEAGKHVLIKFREAHEKTWHEGLPMRYNPINDFNTGQKTPECKGDYRGSIVNLTPGATYEIALTLQGTDIRTNLKAATWSENFPIASKVKCPSSNTTLEITKSGTPEGYILYDGTGATIDTANKSDMGIDINAEYIIIRGFTIKNVKTNGINITKGHHIVIENCDISKWGSEDPDVKGSGFGIEMNAGIYCKKDHDLHALVIQRNKIHNPTWNTNYWSQKHHTFHPDGPQTIVMWECEGNNVIRYNECFSDDNHKFDDTMGGAINPSYRGWPGRDSDIYCNYVANCADDGIEVEGGGQNIRVFHNYIEHTMMMIADAPVSIGPLYVFDNVTGPSYTPDGGSGGKWHNTNGYFMKMGFAKSADWMTGHMYVFNNTIFQGPNNNGADGLGGDSKMIKHCVTRNNIFQARPDNKNSISTDKKGSTDNDFNDDLISHRVPEGSEKEGIKGLPKYVSGAGFNFETKTGNFAQAPDSPGYHKALVIPNFCEPVNGQPPDIGAVQGNTPFVVGVKAEYIPPQSK